MKKLFTLFILISSFSFAQDFQGKAFYMSKLSVDKSWMDNPRFASIIAYLNYMIKKNTEKNYVLAFNSLNHFTQREKNQMWEKSRYNWMAVYVGNNIGKLYKNLQDKVSINETEMMGKFFLLQIQLKI